MAEKQNLQPLNPMLIEQGTILKEKVCDTETTKIAFFWLSPGAKTKEHNHPNEEELIWLDAGPKCRCTIDGKVYLLTESENCKCLAGQQHSIENTSKQEIRILSFKCVK